MQRIILHNKDAYFFQDQKEVLEYLIYKWRQLAGKAIEERGVFTVALAGGTTPQPFFEALSKEKDLPWDKTHIFSTDERFVPIDDKDSNAGVLKKHLLDHVSISESNIHLIDTNFDRVEDAAKNHEDYLRKFFSVESGQNVFPNFDLMLLGIGQDGHMVSLFPKTKALEEKELWVTTNQSSKHTHKRITMTLPLINAARELIFLVTGQHKTEIIKEIFHKNKKSYPASMVEKCTLVTDVKVED